MGARSVASWVQSTLLTLTSLVWGWYTPSHGGSWYLDLDGTADGIIAGAQSGFGRALLLSGFLSWSRGSGHPKSLESEHEGLPYLDGIVE